MNSGVHLGMLIIISCFVAFHFTFAEQQQPEINKSNFIKESRILFYKMAQSIVMKKEIQDCTVVIVHGNRGRNHDAPEVGLIMQQAALLQPVITINYREKFTFTHHKTKYHTSCYTVFAEFGIYKQENYIQKKLKSIFEAFLPNAKFILRFNADDIRIKQELLFGSYLSRFSWDILQVAVDYNKLNQMRVLLYSFCPNCPIAGKKPHSTSPKVGVPILSSGMGHDGIIKEYQSSLFPNYNENFQGSYFHLIYHPSTLDSVVEKGSISAEEHLSFHMISLIAGDLNLTINKEKIQHENELGMKISDEDNWNGYMGRLINLKNTVGLAFITHSKYMDAVDVTHPYSTFSIGMMYMDITHSDRISVWAAFSMIYNFEFLVKITLFSFFIGTIMYGIEYVERKKFPRTKGNQTKAVTKGKWKNYVWMSIKIWYQQPFTLPRSTHLKTSVLFIFTWWMTCILYTAFIKTFLISIMSQPVKSTLVTSLSDLMEKENWSWGTFLKPSVWKDIVGNSTYAKLTNEMQYFDSHSACIERVSESKFACIGAAGILKSFHAVTKKDKSGTHLVYIDSELMPLYLTFAFKKNNPYGKIISKKLQSVVEAEMNHKYLQDAFNMNFLKRRKRDFIKSENEGSNDQVQIEGNSLYAVEVEAGEFDLTFAESLSDSFEDIFEIDMDDLFSSVLFGFVLSIIIFIIEHMVYAIHTLNLVRNRCK